MSCMSVVAGPDVDMVELEGGPVVGNVDLDLNLGPPAPDLDGLALGLGLGQVPSDLEVAAQVSRHNWPRFEPGMSGLFPVANQDIEPFLSLDGPHHVIAVNSSSVGSADPLTDPLEGGRLRISSQETQSPGLPDPALQLDNGGDQGRQSHSTHSHTRHRFRRISRQLLRSRHTLDRPETQSTVQVASPAESTSGLHFVDAEEFTPSLVVLGALDSRRNADAPRDCLHGSVVTPKGSAPKLNIPEVKETDGGSSLANFDCNICLDLAKEPVVTSCGHLFCWPCLYQWLHVHSHWKECPVCKGHVTDDAVTPIYGRGNAQAIPKTSFEQRSTETPPRPHAHRIENLRRWQRSGPSEGHRLVRDAEGINRDDRLEGQRDMGMTFGGLSSGVGRSAEQILHRLRIAQRLQREHLEQRFTARHRVLLRSPSVESRIGDTVRLENVQVGVDEVQLYDDREHILTQMAINRLQRADRLAVIRARLVASMDGLLENLSNVRGSTVETGSSAPILTGISGGVGREGVVTGQDVPEVAELIAGGDRRSTSVTVLADNVIGAAQLDPSVAPSSTQQRRRHEALGGASSSSDVDSGLLHARKRRRLN